MMKGQIAGLMRQAQQMQDKMKQVQDSLEQEIVEGQSGNIPNIFIIWMNSYICNPS